MEGKLIGYFPKRTSKQPTWLNSPAVEEICSVSTCISEGPDDWIEAWRHNEQWVYDSPKLAWSVVPEKDYVAFDLYAYRIFPIEFRKGVPTQVILPEIHATPLNKTFKYLGYDVVSSTTGNAFECSPLSCNNWAEKVQVNRHCLLDSLDMAFDLANKVEAEGAEPGPYYVVEVYRKEAPSR
jgi:hypothetical protein